MLVRQVADAKLAQFAYLIGCPRTGEAIVIDPERDVDQFCSIAGSYVPEDTPVYLVVDESRLDEAVRALIRVGLDHVAGYITPDTLADYGRQGGQLRHTATIDMGELEAQRTVGRGHVLDVRGAAEFEAGYVPDTLHVPHTRIGINADTLPTDKPLLVYCNSGARAAAAVAMLERLGLTAIDVNDNVANYRRADHVAAQA